jgi:hypothetical protein
MKEAPGSSETSVLTRDPRRNIPEDTIRKCYCYEVNKFLNKFQIGVGIFSESERKVAAPF